ncbi:DnaD domain-containing protein [Listeria booriae]|uniref:DnaD domain-containing protein n=1 Tax=Listeria booriae TaxID=1552123 RepID=UPI001628D821|nr:DnaD domain protein [Listeria booriae]MBC2318755.1 DnaD domain protein [Listeria booriae]
MAQRRMFSKNITDTDAFVDMPLSSQCLYFHLNMSADDDGFVDSVKKIKRVIGASDDDLKILMAKQFLIPFDTGIVVIRDWKIHNYIRGDRYRETVHQEEKSQLSMDSSKRYTKVAEQVQPHVIPPDIPNADQRETQVRLGKDRLGKDSIGKISIDYEEEKTIHNNNPDYSSSIAAWEAVYGFPNAVVLKDIQEAIDEMTDSLVIEAIRRTSLEQIERKGAWRYTRAILNNWKQLKITTLEQVQQADRNWEIGQQAKNNGKGYKKGGRQEVVPNWFDKDEVLPPHPKTQEQPKTQEELDCEVAEMKRKLKEGRT